MRFQVTQGHVGNISGPTTSKISYTTALSPGCSHGNDQKDYCVPYLKGSPKAERMGWQMLPAELVKVQEVYQIFYLY